MLNTEPPIVNYAKLDHKEKKGAHTNIQKILCKDSNIFTLTDTQEIYIYDSEKGIYTPNGDVHIAMFIHNYFKGTETNNCVNEIIGSVKRGTYIDRKEFLNNNEAEVCLQNGVLNIETRELKRHIADKHFIVQLPLTYDAEAKCPQIDSFLDDVTSSDKEDNQLLEEILGWCLLNRYFMHKIVVLVGTGRNGKTTFLNLLRAFLGKDNCSSVELKDLCESRFSAANLYGKLANVCTELTHRSLRNTGKIKSLTGEDSITAEHKFQSPFQFTNKAKMLFSTNELPKFTEDSTAIWSRFIIIDFVNSFGDDNPKTDKNILAKLTQQIELSGLLNKALDGLDRLIKNGKFTNSLPPEETRNRYLDRSDPFYRFISTCLDEGEHDDFISRKDMYSIYKGFCVSNNLAPASQSKFTRDFVKFITAYYKEIKLGAFSDVLGNSIRGYRNVTMKFT